MPKKVLVVDDSLLLLRMYELALKSYARSPIEPVMASDGREAFVRLQENPDVALILLDVNMPTMSGLEFLERLRTEPAFQNIRVVLQSTEDQIQDVRRGLAAGAVGYLTKPFTPRQLHQLLDVVLV